MPVDRELPTPEAHDLLALTRELADAELAPRAGQYEREERFPREVFRTLGDAGINIDMISTSPIKISCVVPGDAVKQAVQQLHAAFELSGPDTIRPERPFGEFAA